MTSVGKNGSSCEPGTVIQKVTEEEGGDGAEDSVEEAEVVSEEETQHNGTSREDANEDPVVHDQEMEEEEEVDTNTVQIALPESIQFSSEAADLESSSKPQTADLDPSLKPQTAELRAKRIEKIQQDVTSGGVSGELIS